MVSLPEYIFSYEHPHIARLSLPVTHANTPILFVQPHLHSGATDLLGRQFIEQVIDILLFFAKENSFSLRNPISAQDLFSGIVHISILNCKAISLSSIQLMKPGLYGNIRVLQSVGCLASSIINNRF